MSVSSVCKSMYQGAIAFGAKAVNAISRGASYITAKVSVAANYVFQNKIALAAVSVVGVVLIALAVKKLCSKDSKTVEKTDKAAEKIKTENKDAEKVKVEKDEKVTTTTTTTTVEKKEEEVDATKAA